MQLRSATTVSDYQWIYPGDDALARPQQGDATDEDHTKVVDAFESELATALESGDMSRVPVKPGATVALWTLRHLDGLARDWLQNMLQTAIGNSEQMIYLFRMCVSAALVDCSGVTDAEGEEIEVDHVFDKKLGFLIVRAETLNTLANFDGLLMRMGAAVLESLRPKRG